MKDYLKKLAVTLGTQMAVNAAFMAVNTVVVTVVNRKVNELLGTDKKKQQ